MAPGAVGRWRRAAVPLVGLLVVAGIVLRLWSHSPLWLDEVQSVQLAKVPLSDLPAALKTDGAPPLYYVLLHAWISVFGDGVWTVRALSMLASVLALPLTWLVARRLGAGREVAAIAVVLCAVNPWSVRYAGEARMYSLVALEVLLGTLALLRLIAASVTSACSRSPVVPPPCCTRTTGHSSCWPRSAWGCCWWRGGERASDVSWATPWPVWCSAV